MLGLNLKHLRFAVAAVCMTSSLGRASEIDQQTPTFFVTATEGYSVYKSEMVESNDTSTTLSYGLGVYAGSGRNIGMVLKRESSTFSFPLNGSSLSLAWQDTHIRYRWGPVYAGVLLANSTWLVKAPPDADADGHLDVDGTAEDYLDLVTSGYGMNVGTMITISRRSYMYVDLTYSTTSEVRQKALTASTGANAGIAAEKTVVVGPRMDLDLGGSIGITKNVLDATCGFKYRTYNISVDGTAYKEQLNSTYLGLSAGWQF